MTEEERIRLRAFARRVIDAYEGRCRCRLAGNALQFYFDEMYSIKVWVPSVLEMEDTSSLEEGLVRDAALFMEGR